MTKAEIIQTGLKLRVDYSITSTCYDPSPEGVACGACDACVLRLKGFAEQVPVFRLEWRKLSSPRPTG